jgi:hypothetical protein
VRGFPEEDLFLRVRVRVLGLQGTCVRASQVPDAFSFSPCGAARDVTHRGENGIGGITHRGAQVGRPLWTFLKHPAHTINLLFTD